MSRLVEKTVTLTIRGDERDVPVRCWVDVGPISASLDGDPEMLIGGEWVDMTKADAEALTDALCEQGMQDELDAASDIDPDEYAIDDERSCA